MLDPNQLLAVANVAIQGLHSVSPVALAYVGLIVTLSLVAVFGNGPRAKRAHAVLKLLLPSSKGRSKRGD